MRPASFALYAAIAGFSFYLLVVGRALILPFVVAVTFWYLIWTLARSWGRLGLPGWLALTLALASFAALLAAFVELTLGHIERVVEAAPIYQANLEARLGEAAAFLGLRELPTADEIGRQIDLGGLAGELAAGIATLAGNVGIILVYTAFLLVEQKGFATKLEALAGHNRRRLARLRRTLARIEADVQTYIRVKTLLSLATGAVSYGVMVAVGLDLAAFWALLIALLNYIPTIGSILGIVFPALLALVQFPEPLVPFLVVAALLGVTQVVTGNVLEPRMMGRSLAISPLVILMSLALWGSVWGVIGMFLSVPITVIAMIVMAQFPATRPLAILLSSHGSIAHLEDGERPEGGERRAEDAARPEKGD